MRRGRILVLFLVVLTACSQPAEPSATTSTSSASAASTGTGPPPPTTTTSADDGLPTMAGPAPWTAPPLPIGDVAEVLVSEWIESSNRERCAALFPSQVDQGTSVRSADFGQDGWGVAWDLPSGPGRAASGEYCDDGGRGAFGVAGALDTTEADISIWPTRVRWDDGSEAGYGYEGLVEPGSGAPHLMYLRVTGEECLYNVWSFLGEDHLLRLVDRLRRVAGLDGDADGPAEGVALAGVPSWIAEDPIPPSDVSSEYLVEWTQDAGAPEWCPLLVFDGLGDDASDAGIRRATNFGEMLVAWDRPEGPGHDASGEPCDDCGRGAVGLGTFQGPVEMRHPITHMWDDGSIGSLFDGLYGSEMLLRPAGFDCTYWLWSHLGDGHLSGLVSRLRRVEAHP